MAKHEDIGQKAAEFLKHWQAQMTKQMHDSDVIRAMLAAMKQFGESVHDEATRKPSHASDAGHGAIRQLERRVESLERQLADFISVVTKTQNTPRTGSGRSLRADAKRKRPVGGSKRAVPKKSGTTKRTKRK